MNIKITYNWLLEYLDTDADPYEIQKYVSLSGPSIERVEKVGDDYVFDIEVTSNRVDTACVFGFAQECTAILPQFDKRAVLKHNPLLTYVLDTLEKVDEASVKPLIINILDDTLVSRVSGIVLSNIKIGPSPEFMKNRLDLCDIRSINNVVDISNYLMLSLGQPTHTFDYDKIKDHVLTIRISKKGETIKTLDEKLFKLPGDDIVIEDGSGELIDLAGIMGGSGTAITDNTKTVLLFLETYNKQKIRKTSMLTGQRTMAATYFEKGLDTERIEPTIMYGVELLKQYAHGTVASPVYDHYKNKRQSKELTVTLSEIENLSGVSFESTQIITILQNLGFTAEETTDRKFTITVPTYRYDDIDTPEDIIEEVTRIYGYHNLPSVVQKTQTVHQPESIKKSIATESKSKRYLKHVGLHETYNYSMVSQKLLKDLDMQVDDHLHIKNTISTEIEYMRTSLLPSLIKNCADNSGKREALAFFEIAHAYQKRSGDLPLEIRTCAIAQSGNYFSVKGIVEGLFDELHIDNRSISFKPSKKHYLLDSNVQAEIHINGEPIGIIGQLAQKYCHAFELKQNIILTELNFATIVEHAQTLASYTPINPYAVVKLDLTIDMTGKTYAIIDQKIRETSPLITDIDLLTIYKNTITLRLYFSDSSRNITEDEAKIELEKIQKII